MIKERFTITQKEDYFYVRDEVNKKPMGMFEFKQDEFPVYFCFHKIIDLLNEQHERIQRLKDENYELKQTVTQLLKESKETSQKKEYEKYNIQPYAIMKRKGDVE